MAGASELVNYRPARPQLSSPGMDMGRWSSRSGRVAATVAGGLLAATVIACGSADGGQPDADRSSPAAAVSAAKARPSSPAAPSPKFDCAEPAAETIKIDMRRLDQDSNPAYPPDPAYAVYAVNMIHYRIVNRSRHPIEVSYVRPTITFQAPPGLDRLGNIVPPLRLTEVTVTHSEYPKYLKGHGSSEVAYVMLVEMPLKVTSGKPEVTDISLVWRYADSGVGRACNADDELHTTG